MKRTMIILQACSVILFILSLGGFAGLFSAVLCAVFLGAAFLIQCANIVLLVLIFRG